MKKCSKCGELKDFSEFPKRKDSPDGFRNECKACRLNYQRKWNKEGSNKIEYKDSEGKKQCRKCMKILNADEFGSTKYTKDGLKSYCKYCKRQESNEWRKKNPNYNEEYRRENLEKRKEYGIEYYRKNKKILTIKNKEYVEKNKKSVSEQKKRWYDKNKEKVKENKRRRRARIAGCDERYTAGDERITLVAFDNKCFNCSCTSNLHIDHHRPLIDGYPLSIGNAVVLCETCNKSKGTKSPEDFYGINVCTKLDIKLAELERKYIKSKGDKK